MKPTSKKTKTTTPAQQEAPLAALNKRVPKPSKKVVIAAALRAAEEDHKTRRAAVDAKIEELEGLLSELILSDYSLRPDNYSVEMHDYMNFTVVLKARVTTPEMQALQDRIESLDMGVRKHFDRNQAKTNIAIGLGQKTEDALVEGLVSDPATRAALLHLAGVEQPLTLEG